MAALQQYLAIADLEIAAHADELAKAGAIIERCAAWTYPFATSAYVDFQVRARLARIVVWPNGAAEMQVLNEATGGDRDRCGSACT